MKSNIIAKLRDRTLDLEIDNLDKYHTSGIWALYGTKDGKEKCLEVGINLNMAREIQNDITTMKTKTNNKVSESFYNARRLFPEFQETFRIYKGETRTEAKYHYIVKNYTNLYFKLVKVEDKYVKKIQIESEYAIDNKALYWNACYGQIKVAKIYYNKCLNLNGKRR